LFRDTCDMVCVYETGVVSCDRTILLTQRGPLRNPRFSAQWIQFLAFPRSQAILTGSAQLAGSS
jgi:hypothetical protein